MFDDAGKPVSAVITFVDVTKQLEKELIYNKWQQSLDERADDSYTLFRCNLSKGASYDSWEGGLLKYDFSKRSLSFNDYTAQYVDGCVYEEDRKKYLAFMNLDTLIANYYRKHRSSSIEYREKTEDGGVRWLRLSLELVEYPNSKDIEAYMLFENIDERKKAELLTIERSERDPLTGVLNRATFISRLEHIISTSAPNEKHALFMLDVDEFKHVNDTLGHGAGDEVLLSLIENISALLRHDDLIGRLGGDEFFVFLKSVSGKDAAAAKAKQICALNIRAKNFDASVTVSIGIAMAPRDGSDFDTLYKKVDTALYKEKERGKDGFMFYEETQEK